jgi:glycosyltransferase involved in cell wall biosynthesis
VIASNLPGVRVPVQKTGMGRLVPPRDSEALAEALIDVLDHPAAYRGQPEVITHSSTPEAVGAEYEAIFERLLNKAEIQLPVDYG